MAANLGEDSTEVSYTASVLEPRLDVLRAELGAIRGELHSLQNPLSGVDLSSLRSDLTNLRGDVSLLQSSSPSTTRVVEPPVIGDLKFAGDSKAINSFLLAIYDVMEAVPNPFSSDARKISWVARHFSVGSPVHDWWFSQLQENARAHSRAHPNAPRLAGTYSVAGVPFILPVLLDISLFLQTLAQLFSDPYASETALRDFQSLTMGKLSIVQFNAKFTALAFRVDASEPILMDYYRKALTPAVYQRSLARAYWATCSSLQDLMNVAVLAAHQEDAIALAHRQRSAYHPSVNSPHSGVMVPHDPSAMDVSAVTSQRSSNRPATRFPFNFYRELCQARGACWRCLKPFDDVHRANKAAGKPICANSPVSAADMDSFCASCTATPATPISGPPHPVQAIASTVVSPVMTPPPPAPVLSPHPYPLYHYPPHLSSPGPASVYYPPIPPPLPVSVP